MAAEPFIEGKEINLVVILLTAIYFLVVYLSDWVWGLFSYTIGVPLCVSTSGIFLIIFVTLIIHYIKKVESHLVMGVIFITLSILMGLMAMVFRYVAIQSDSGAYDSVLTFFLYMWCAGMFIGIVFLIYSLIVPDKGQQPPATVSVPMEINTPNAEPAPVVEWVDGDTQPEPPEPRMILPDESEIVCERCQTPIRIRSVTEGIYEASCDCGYSIKRFKIIEPHLQGEVGGLHK